MGKDIFGLFNFRYFSFTMFCQRISVIRISEYLRILEEQQLLGTVHHLGCSCRPRSEKQIFLLEKEVWI